MWEGWGAEGVDGAGNGMVSACTKQETPSRSLLSGLWLAGGPPSFTLPPPPAKLVKIRGNISLVHPLPPRTSTPRSGNKNRHCKQYRPTYLRKTRLD